MLLGTIPWEVIPFLLYAKTANIIYRICDIRNDNLMCCNFRGERRMKSQSSSSSSRVSNHESGYATSRKECNLYAKPWSELSEYAGPNLESSIAPSWSATMTRSLDLSANLFETQDANIDSLTTLSSLLRTTTSAVYRHLKNLLYK